jgi:hypothetical protein
MNKYKHRPLNKSFKLDCAVMALWAWQRLESDQMILRNHILDIQEINVSVRYATATS